MRGLRFFDWFLFPFSLLVLLASGMSTLAAFITPGKNWLVSLSALAFPLLYLLNLVFILYWISRKKWLFVSFHGIIFIAGFRTFNAQWAWNKSDSFSESDSTFSVLSFNARNFDFYNWTGNYFGTSTIRQDAMNMIRELNPGIICFQEFFHCDTGKYRIRHYMTDSLGYKEQFLVLPVKLNNYQHWGMAIYSRYPIINTGQIDFAGPEGNRPKNNINLCLFADVQVNSDTIRVYNVHFQSIRFGADEYKLMLDNTLQANEENLKGIKSMIRRMKMAQNLRTRQLNKVLTHLKESQHPVIFCTDFNDTPSSWAYRQLTEKLKDSFLEKGRGTGITYAGPFPAFRIDYIFHSKEIDCYHFRVIKKELSDHYPLYGHYRLARKR